MYIKEQRLLLSSPLQFFFFAHPPLEQFEESYQIYSFNRFVDCMHNLDNSQMWHVSVSFFSVFSYCPRMHSRGETEKRTLMVGQLFQERERDSENEWKNVINVNHGNYYTQHILKPRFQKIFILYHFFWSLMNELLCSR